MMINYMDNYKQILVKRELHGQVKAAAALLELSIREFAEQALRAKLADSPLVQLTEKEQR